MLQTSIVEISTLTEVDRATMFNLYRRNYDGGEPSVFFRDLDAKNCAVVLRDESAIIRGFSTVVVYDENFAGKPVRVLYSGDTIIEPAYWGQNQMSKAWLELAGSIKQEAPDTPLYWLLIVKGHRTYRYLSLFSNDYYPRHDVETPVEMQSLMNHLATRKFGDQYDATAGLVKFSGCRSYLSADLASIPDKDSGRLDVQYFLSRNPKYYEGDELLCVCELSADNLTRLARQWFEAGRLRSGLVRSAAVSHAGITDINQKAS
ncbi:MAG: hypothetical protein U0103_22515 [Candidatus Obscuribacterales bacterium]